MLYLHFIKYLTGHVTSNKRTSKFERPAKWLLCEERSRTRYFKNLTGHLVRRHTVLRKWQERSNRTPRASGAIRRDVPFDQRGKRLVVERDQRTSGVVAVVGRRENCSRRTAHAVLLSTKTFYGNFESFRVAALFWPVCRRSLILSFLASPQEHNVNFTITSTGGGFPILI